ncbi:MAG: quinone-dependent dihydroorotate dehydrogenase [Proteobacteria bacterium]|jgi:dihydroorotate dehydrogenase|nr:quinone-dependent dihydroorotate dehydrogenase [Pseudomonadota bacterium]
MYKRLLKPLLFKLDAETAHHFVFSTLKILFLVPGISSISRCIYSYNHASLQRNLMGLKFPNPVGLAAGFDKNARLFDELSNFGFGFIEIGTATPKPQAGNPRPRLFRLPLDQALINRMGFNNDGTREIARRLRSKNSRLIIGGNIGKNKDTPNDQAVNDYMIAFEELFEHVDYFVVNVSSPNTPNLRELQDKKPLSEILDALQTINHSKPHAKPILLKIAPDLNEQQLDDVIDIVRQTRIQGVIATNTTISREGLATDSAQVDSLGAGGLSGKPLKNQSTEVIRYLANKSKKSFIIIGVGGIHSADDAVEKIQAGADLVQIYTGFIYEGPALIKQINKRFKA